MENFYIVLPSNVKDVYNKNTIGTYKTKLPKRFLLKGKWEVGLTEITYPKTYYNIESPQTFFITSFNYKHNFVPSTESKIPPGHYEIKDLVRIINKIIKKTMANEEDVRKLPQLKFRNLKITLSTGIIERNRERIKITLLVDKNLAEVLGFRGEHDNSMIQIRKKGVEEPNDIEAIEFPDTSAGFTSFYVYCDLVKHKIVGDIEVQLLRTVQINRNNNPVISYINPQYSPLITNEFDSIEISIKNDMGNNVIFTSGKTISTLHFKQVL